MSGPTVSLAAPNREWCFRAYRNRPGATIPKRRLGTFIVSIKFQPDLNTANPHVQAELLKIMGFWIQLGVSGFRMDAVPFVIATKGADVRQPKEQYGMLRQFREFLQWRQGDCIILGEANVLPKTDLA